jgi:hypothetical protein
MRAKLIVIGMICLFPMQLAGQSSLTLDAGAKVRIWTSDIRKVTGRVDALTSDTLVLKPEGETTALSIPVASIVRAEVSRGPRSRKSSAWNRARWGALFGAVVGAVSLGLQHEQVGDEGSSVGKAVALGAWSGVLFGGSLGAAIGAANPGENWERVR